VAIRGSVAYEITGIRALELRLDRVAASERVAVGEACAETAIGVEQRAKTHLLQHRDRGDLIRAVGRSGRGLRYRVGIEDGAVPARGGTNTAHLNPWVYGRFLHYGTRHPVRDAFPFMEMAAAAEQAPHERRLARALGEAVS
jgi:hypothetical protein